MMKIFLDTQGMTVIMGIIKVTMPSNMCSSRDDEITTGANF